MASELSPPKIDEIISPSLLPPPSSPSASPSTSPVSPSSSIQFQLKKEISSTSFGSVYLAVNYQEEEEKEKTEPPKEKEFALKWIREYDDYQHELLCLQATSPHPNVVSFFDHFVCQKKSFYFVFEFVPLNLLQVIGHYVRHQIELPFSKILHYSKQMLRAISHIHSCLLIHRDIKPSNFLIDPTSQVLKMCDFGSSCFLSDSTRKIAYVCSRPYRAPELILGATDYGQKIDLWSCGCVFAEMILLRPMFSGASPMKQLVQIMLVLGKPDQNQLESMKAKVSINLSLLPNLKPKVFETVFPENTSKDFISMIQMFFNYDPSKRPTAQEALAFSDRFSQKE
mmetsp:Transcript_20278/g.27983  ORF Transcript_20278/g.27983 Transcript_20278/m.27983 type:complete len:340 (+) Transcript_20278:182-1201(+)